jgi:hypothetical protein
MHRAGTLRANAAAMERSTKLRGRCYLACTPFHWCPALLLVASFLSCGGLAGLVPSQLPPSSVTVTLVPSNASVFLGDPLTFTATVANTADRAVSWSVNGIPGGNATVGTIDADGVYTAPANLPSPALVSVQAVSEADDSKNSIALVTIASGISVSVSPQTMLVELGASRPFTGTRPSAQSPDAPLSDDDRTGLRVLYPDPADSVHIGTISGRVQPGNPLALPISPAGIAGIFPAQVVAVDNTSGMVAAAVMAGVAATPARRNSTVHLPCTG